MKISNIHHRNIDASKDQVLELLSTLSSKHDLIWPWEKWPKMILDQGLSVGSKGGHGPIGYSITQYEPSGSIQFEFSKPEGFKGYHRLDINEYDEGTRLTHVINMRATAWGYIQWIVGVRWLHDALIEDAFDKVENQFGVRQVATRWSWKVRVLRSILAT